MSSERKQAEIEFLKCKPELLRKSENQDNAKLLLS